MFLFNAQNSSAFFIRNFPTIADMACAKEMNALVYDPVKNKKVGSDSAITLRGRAVIETTLAMVNSNNDVGVRLDHERFHGVARFEFIISDSKLKMKIKTLEQLVKETGATRVTYKLQGGTVSFDVPSPTYEEKKYWLVKGSYAMRKDFASLGMVLWIDRLEKELQITLNRPTISPVGATPAQVEVTHMRINVPIEHEARRLKLIEIEDNIGVIISIDEDNGQAIVEPYKKESDKINDMINTKLTVVIFHRHTLVFSAKEVKRQHVRAYAEACVASYRQAHSDAKPEDFAIVEIVWNDRHVALTSLE